MAARARQVKKPRPRVQTRPARGAERHLDAEGMHKLWDRAGESLTHGTITEKTMMAADLARVTQHAIVQGDSSAIFAWSHGREELERALTERLARYVAAGRRQVAGELARQGEEPSGVQLAEKPNPKTSPGVAGVAEAAVAATAMALSYRILARMQAQASLAVQGALMGAQAPSVAELEASIAASADDEVLRLRAVVHDLVALGRSEEAKANSDRIADAVYSSLLDGNSCEECAAMDGQETTDLAEAEAWAPNPSCAGGDRCRCVVVYELRQ